MSKCLTLASRHTSALIEAARDDSPVSGLTHNFYRYPARFSPRFVRAAIEAFTRSGDLVLDPFMGGGTTLVEALALGRSAVGADISALATFVSSVKTTCYTTAELTALDRWAAVAHQRINIHAAGVPEISRAGLKYQQYMDGLNTWRLRKAIGQAIHTIHLLSSTNARDFARCVVLRTAQWAMDGKKKLATIDQFRSALVENALEMIASAREFGTKVAGVPTSVICLHRTSAGLETDKRVRGRQTPKLVLTSPPYPGVHVLYHRWQVGGGKETAAPFWIANQLDGSGEAYYAMGCRKARQLKSYFKNLKASMRSVAALCGSETVVVQVVAFSEPEWQLPAYLAIANDVGLTEVTLPDVDGEADHRLWRYVPNRRWYTTSKGKTHGSNEVVLFHRRQL